MRVNIYIPGLVKQQPLNLQQKAITRSWLVAIKISAAVQRDIIEITKSNNVDLMEFDVLLLILFVYFVHFLKSNIRGWTS